MKTLDQEVSDIINKLYLQYKEDSPKNFIQSILDRMVMKTVDEYHTSIFYLIDDKVYFEMFADEQERKNAYLYCRYADFWIVLQSKFLLNYNDIQELIKSMMEQHLKQEVGTTGTCEIYTEITEG